MDSEAAADEGKGAAWLGYERKATRWGSPASQCFAGPQVHDFAFMYVSTAERCVFRAVTRSLTQTKARPISNLANQMECLRLLGVIWRKLPLQSVPGNEATVAYPRRDARERRRTR